MNTETNITGDFIAEAMRRVDTAARDLPIANTLSELQLVVERLSFSGLWKRPVQNDPMAMAEIDQFFRDEVTPGMVGFIRWVAEQNLLAALAGRAGRVFLDHCIDKYRYIEEIKFYSAVELPEDFKDELTAKLRLRHPEPARICFGVASSVVAGFVLETRRDTIDLSLRTHVSNLVTKSVKTTAAVESGEVNE